jgi:hypothetical protein
MYGNRIERVVLFGSRAAMQRQQSLIDTTAIASANVATVMYLHGAPGINQVEAFSWLLKVRSVA